MWKQIYASLIITSRKGINYYTIYKTSYLYTVHPNTVKTVSGSYIYIYRITINGNY